MPKPILMVVVSSDLFSNATVSKILHSDYSRLFEVMIQRGVFMFFLLVCTAILSASATNTAGRIYSVEEVHAMIEDPQMRDIFDSALARMKDMTPETDFSQV